MGPMGFTTTAIVIAVLAGIGTYFSWNSNKALSMGLAVLTAIAGALGLIGAFFWALGVFFKLLPLALLIFGIWLIYRVATGNSGNSGNSRDSTSSGSSRDVR